MVLVPIKCLHCGSIDVIRHGQTSNEKQRFLCRNDDCGKTFIPAFRVKLGQIHHNLPFAAWLRIQRSKDDLGTMISMSARMSRKTEREIPRASSGPTRRAMSSRWAVDNSVDGYLRFSDMGLFRRRRWTQFYPKCWIQEYSDKGRLPEIKQRIVDMAVNGSGVRDTARVLDISTDTVINELKKRGQNCKRLTTLS